MSLTNTNTGKITHHINVASHHLLHRGMGQLSVTKSHTLPSSPTHSSNSDFEFTVSIPPHKSSAADELFYKGQLLPLHLSPRLRLLLLSSASSSSDSATTASRDSTASLSDSSSSSRPSSVADDEFKRLTTTTATNLDSFTFHTRRPSKYFSLPKFSSGAAAVKRASSSARGVIRKYLKKVKPLYEKLSQKQHHQHKMFKSAKLTVCSSKDKDQELKRNSFSGNLTYPRRRRRSCVSSCPSSIGSSPSHERNEFASGFGLSKKVRAGSGICYSDSSSMEELQSAIQGAIAHCKNSMLQNSKDMVISGKI